MSHTATLGQDPRGNLTRIDNLLQTMPKRLEGACTQLENLINQQANAEIEKDKPFLQEEELKQKSEQLIQLDIELNLADKGDDEIETTINDEEKSTRPSVLDSLKQQPQAPSIKKEKTEREER